MTTTIRLRAGSGAGTRTTAARGFADSNDHGLSYLSRPGRRPCRRRARRITLRVRSGPHRRSSSRREGNYWVVRYRRARARLEKLLEGAAVGVVVRSHRWRARLEGVAVSAAAAGLEGVETSSPPRVGRAETSEGWELRHQPVAERGGVSLHDPPAPDPPGRPSRSPPPPGVNIRNVPRGVRPPLVHAHDQGPEVGHRRTHRGHVQSAGVRLAVAVVT